MEYGDQKNTVTEDTAGNIGTVTNARMASEELNLRVNNLTDYILNQFVKQYLFLSTIV